MDDCQKRLVEQWANLEGLLLSIKENQDLIIADLKTEVYYLKEKVDAQSIMLKDAFNHIRKIEKNLNPSDNKE